MHGISGLENIQMLKYDFLRAKIQTITGLRENFLEKYIETINSNPKKQEYFWNLEDLSYVIADLKESITFFMNLENPKITCCSQCENLLNKTLKSYKIYAQRTLTDIVCLCEILPGAILVQK